MKLPLLLLCAAAGLSGWLGVSWLAGPARTRGSGRAAEPVTAPAAAPVESEAAALRSYAGPRQSSARLAELAGRLERTPFSELKRLLAMVESWPAGVPREMALALLHARLAPERVDAPGPVVNKEPGTYEGLALALAADRESDNWNAHLADWTRLDPAAARAAVLGMPPGKMRREAVDNVAEVLRHDDAAGAMAFVLESRENFLTSGTAAAWRAVAGQDAKTAAALLSKMNALQQDSLAEALAQALQGEWVDGSAGMEEVKRLAGLVFSFSGGAGKEALLRELCQRDPAAVVSGDSGNIYQMPAFFTEHAQAQAAVWEQSLLDDAPGALPGILAAVSGGQGQSSAVLNAAAKRLLPQLARSGHVAEAVQLLQKVEDRGAWRAAFQELLPYWMDHDPAAARAALDAAPLTALERERWAQQPAFLLQRD